MSEQTNGAPATGAPAQQPESAPLNVDTAVAKDVKPATDKDGKKPADAAAAGEKKLTGAELKAKAKADKAARRAQQKNTKEVSKAEAAVSSHPLQLGPAASEVKGKPKGKDGAAAAQGGRPALTKAPTAIVTEQKTQIPECFSYLAMAKRTAITQADKDVHPVVLALGQQMATFAIDESITRLRATLLAFKKVIQSYTTPPGHTLARHFTPHVLNPQIEYLTACRTMCYSMGNAIKWLKLQVSKIDMDASEDDAKRDLCQAIDTFVTERITVAEEVVTEAGAKSVQDGDVILTYARSTVVERSLLLAKACGTKFSVFIIDDPYEKPGQAMARTLAAADIDVSYSGDFGGLVNHLEKATKVLLGPDAVFASGALYARAGTADIAMTASELGKNVSVLCQTINITERVPADSLAYNEIDPERCQASGFRLLFDITPDKYVHLLTTELGTVQPRSAPDLLRKLEEFS